MSQAKRFTSMVELFTEMGWTQGRLACTEAGIATQVKADNACSFCTVGAVYRVYYEEEDVVRVIDQIQAYIDQNYAGVYNTISEWNDANVRSKWDVMVMCQTLNI